MMRIDAARGTVTLPSGDVLDPDMTQEAFRADPMFPRSRSKSYGTPP